MGLFFTWLYAFGILFCITFFLRIIALVTLNDSLPQLALSEKIHGLLWGTRFDSATAAALALLSIVISQLLSLLLNRKHNPYLYLLLAFSAAIIILTQTGDLIYYLETGRHVGYEIKHFFHDFDGLIFQAWNKYQIWIIASLTCISACMLVVYKLSRFHLENYVHRYTKQSGFSNLLNLILVLCISIIFIRGGISGVPQEPLSAYEIGDSDQARIATNGSYNVLYNLSSRRNGIIKQTSITAISPDETAQQLNDLYPTLAGTQDKQLPVLKNIILIFLESWSEQARLKNSATPNFNKLRDQAITAQVLVSGGRRTTEGMFTTLCSWQNPLGQSVARSQLENNNYLCLPELLGSQGYTSSFFQGSNKNTSSVGNFAQRLGFNYSYGKDDFEARRYPHNSWGAYDQDIYSFMLEQIIQSPEPFLFGVNTNTTHDIVLPESVTPAFKDDLEMSILHFADAALGEFFELYKQQAPEKFNNTLFVVLADHTVRIKGNALEEFAIPNFIWSADLSARVVERPASQRDIAPSILDYLKLPVANHFSGKSLLRDNQSPYFADFYSNGKLGWLEADRLTLIDLHKSHQQCFLWNSQLELSEQSCNDDFLAMQQHALTFSKHSQDALFNNTIYVPE